MSRFEFNQPYQFEGLEPQQIRDDFAELVELTEPDRILRSLAGFLPTATLSEFIDDFMMGRV
jgi:hypothetical protein